eukprot:scaffold321029_cov73-Cyclotella_meneghiniana.AAC.1
MTDDEDPARALFAPLPVGIVRSKLSFTGGIIGAQNKEESNSNFPPVDFDMPNGPTSRILQSQIFARYVKLSFPGYRSFNFLEVQVFDILNTNKALG